MKISGRCLCGSVSYSADTDPVMVVNCHCKDCQRQSGAAMSTNVGVMRDALTIEGETKEFDTIGEERGAPARRVFCPNCGSPIVSLLDDMPDFAFIKAGTLDDTSFVAPEMELWTRSKQPWAPVDEERGVFATGLNT